MWSLVTHSQAPHLCKIIPENRCKALEIVGRRPQSTLPAARALCCRAGTPQAGRWIESNFRSFWTVAGRLWRPVTPSQAPYTHKNPTGNRWKSLEGIPPAVTRPRDCSAADQSSRAGAGDVRRLLSGFGRVGAGSASSPQRLEATTHS